jgi:ribosomal protein S27E
MPTTVTCAGCGETLAEAPAEAPDALRTPCAKCGSTARVFGVEATSEVTVSATATASVERGANQSRATVLFLLLTIGLTVGFGAPWSWWARLIGSLVAVVLSAAFVAVALRYPPVRKRVMSLMHLLTGE